MSEGENEVDVSDTEILSLQQEQDYDMSSSHEEEMGKIKQKTSIIPEQTQI